MDYDVMYCSKYLVVFSEENSGFICKVRAVHFFGLFALRTCLYTALTHKPSTETIIACTSLVRQFAAVNLMRHFLSLRLLNLWGDQDVDGRKTLTFWRRIFFFQILAHPVFKM